MTNKILTYVLFIVASIFVVGLFVTSKSYTQLAIAVVLYPILAYFAVKFFYGKKTKLRTVVIKLPANLQQEAVVKAKIEDETENVADVDKRTFLKFVGATGIFFFISSLLGRRVDSLIFNNKTPQLDAMATDPTQSPGGSPTTNGYSISEIDDGNAVTYYGFINSSGSWLIMREDIETTSFRYAKGSSNFPNNWSSREQLTYDYYYKLF